MIFFSPLGNTIILYDGGVHVYLRVEIAYQNAHIYNDESLRRLVSRDRKNIVYYEEKK